MIKPTELNPKQALACYQFAYGVNVANQQIRLELFDGMMAIFEELSPSLRRVVHLYDDGRISSMHVEADLSIYPVPVNGRAIVLYLDSLTAPVTVHDNLLASRELVSSCVEN